MPIATLRRCLSITSLGLVVFAAGCAGGAKKPDAANELPQGVIDIPAANQVVGRGVAVVGWAIDDQKVDCIDIYVDGHFRASTTPSVHRPDVLKAMPKYAHGADDTVGWQTAIDLGDEPGPHVILAQAVDSSGATRDLGPVTVVMQK